jgi:hypothetical protein
MTQFINDSFVGTDGTLISAHTAESGSSWTQYSAIWGGQTAFTTAQILSNKARATAASGATTGAAAYRSTATPGNADYTVSADFTIVGQPNDFVGLVCRASTGATLNGGFALFRNGTAFALYNLVSVTTLAANITVALTIGETYRLTIGAVGSSVTASVKRLSDSQWLTSAGAFQATQVNCFSVTSTATTAAGVPAMIIRGDAVSGVQVDNFTAVDTTVSATSVTVTGPTSGSIGAPSTNFTATLDATSLSAVVVTPSDGGAGGTFTPASVTISAGTLSGTFTYTASSSGAKTITATNGSGLTNAGSVTYTVSSAPPTTVTLTGPVAGTVSVASTAFTATLNAAAQSSIIITPSDGGAGGVFAPSSVTITVGNSSGTFTYTPSSTGTKTISITNGSGLTNIGTIGYASSPGPTVVPVTDVNLFFSPYNWFSDGAGAMQSTNIRAGSTYAWCNMRGGYLKFKATVGAAGSITLNIDTTSLASVAAAGCPRIDWSVNGAAIQSQLLVSGNTTLPLAAGLSSGTHEVFVWFRGVFITQDGNSAANYDTPNNIFKLTSITLSSGGAVSQAGIKSKRMIVYGDSITEGDLSNGGPRSATSQDAGLVYGWNLAEALDAEVGIVGFYGKTWSHFNSTWSNYAASTTRLFSGLFSPAPDYIFVNYGENDGNPGPASSTVTSTLAAVASAAPFAKIGLIIPFSGKARTNLSAATLPTNAALFDLARYEMSPGNTQWSFDGQHPDQRGHSNLAALLAYKAFTLWSPTAAASPVGFVIDLGGGVGLTRVGELVDIT